MAALPDHAQLLERALRESAELQLAWLRDPTSVHSRSLDGSVGPRPAPAYARLLSPEGLESLEQALRERRYAESELPLLAQQLATLARSEVLREGRRWLAGWLAKPVQLLSESQPPHELLAWLANPRHVGHSAGGLMHALAAALEPHTGFCLDLHERAEQAYVSELARVPVPANPTESTESDETSLVRAERWLSQTDDAAHELTAWLLKHSETTGEGGLGELSRALRAGQLDGLASPQQRLYRLADGARRLGFERDMGARMRAELGQSLLLPMVQCVALSVPHDVRLVQGSLDYGVLSDLSAAQGIGEALMLALVSPAASLLVRYPLGISVSAVVGGLFMQQRADAEYLRRVVHLERQPAAQLARHSALVLLLRSRLAAALLCARHAPVRSRQERLSQLMAAGERALGRELPAGIAALTALASQSDAHVFETTARACELHAALRERFDSDYYLNPRVSDVLRGAAQRGNLLDAQAFGREVGAKTSAGVARILELLG